MSRSQIHFSSQADGIFRKEESAGLNVNHINLDSGAHSRAKTQKPKDDKKRVNGRYQG
jgi:hypothetical protein